MVLLYLSAQIMSQILNILFQTGDINIFVLIQNTENANGDASLTVEMCDIFNFFKFK